jgi:ketosteroid isomerase-like protein
VSKQNVDLVRRLLAAFNERDMTTIRSGLHPDVELQTIVEAQHGHAGAADWIARADSVFDSFEMEVEEIIDAGDQVVAIVHERATGRGSGLQVDQHLAQVLTIQEGRVVRIQSFTDRADALKAMGLED